MPESIIPMDPDATPRAGSRPDALPRHVTPPLIDSRKPRCPPFVEITHEDQLLPYLEHVAQRPYNHGLNACWDLKKGERVLLRVDNWHSDLTIKACQKILEKYEVNYEIKYIDRGPIPQWVGADEVDYYLFRTKELAEWMDMWEEEEKKQNYDKILMGYGGPVLAERFIKIQRMPFITPEILASPAHAMPIEVLNAMDKWTWDRIRSAKRCRITDPEGTDISFTNHDDYWDSKREFYNPDLTAATWTGNEHFGKTYLPGHITGRPWMFHPFKEDGCGVIAGTTNHIAPCDWTQLIVENSRIVEINEGGAFGRKLREVMEKTKDIQYPTFPGKGIMHWWEASIGTNPHIHRPRKDFPSGFVNCLYERVRSGVIHMGFGTIISSMAEREAARMGHLVGHWHLHLYFPTYETEQAGDNETIIENGRLQALDDSAIRKLCAKYGDPELWLDESWNPAVPGLNMKGDYWDHYAKDPLHWVKTELEVCRNYHPMFMEIREVMVAVILLPLGVVTASRAHISISVFTAWAGPRLLSLFSAIGHGMGRITVPEMLRAGYSPQLATGSVAAGGTLGSLIPPSLLFVIYAIFTEQSVSTLFLAGILPGLLSMLGFLITIYVWARVKPQDAPKFDGIQATLGQQIRALGMVWPAALILGIIIIGIYWGFFTPTEAAAISMFVAILIGLGRRRLNAGNLLIALKETAVQTAAIFLIAISAKVFVSFVSLTRIIPGALDMLQETGAPLFLIIAGVVLLYLLLGMFLDSIGILVLTLAFTVPLVESYGLNLIWFGVVVIKLLEIGLITPPVGLNVFVIKSVSPAHVRLEDIFKGVAWFLILDIVVLAMILMIPEVSLFIPNAAR